MENKVMIIPPEECQPYMRVTKKLPSAQGMAVWQDLAFILYDTGCCGVYDLAAKNPEPLDFFKLGSYNDGTPSKEYLNHSNQAMFGNAHYERNPIPLLYVTIGTGIGTDEDGYYYRCAVENIVCKNGRYHAETLQVISFAPEDVDTRRFENPCWGCPAFCVDSETQSLYILSCRYRTTREYAEYFDKNAYIITKFALPSLDLGKKVRLTGKDIQDQFTIPFDTYFTQGGTLINGKIYHTFGCPERGYPDRMLVFDVKEKRLCARMDLTVGPISCEEIECCAPYRDVLLCNTCDGGIYSLSPQKLPIA